MKPQSLMLWEQNAYNCTFKNNQLKLVCQEVLCPETLLLSCSSYQEIVVACSNSQTGQFRLVGGRSQNSGRLEVCEGGQWRAVCGLNDTPLGEICSQLGYVNNGKMNSRLIYMYIYTVSHISACMYAK